MPRVRITKIRSVIDRPKKQKATMEALGLLKINQSREHELNPQVEGMIKSVSHLIKVENL